METTAVTKITKKKRTVDTLRDDCGIGTGRGIEKDRPQSLDFAASLSSFFLCQFAAPILNLGVSREDRRQNASISTSRPGSRGNGDEERLTARRDQGQEIPP